MNNITGIKNFLRTDLEANYLKTNKLHEILDSENNQQIIVLINGLKLATLIYFNSKFLFFPKNLY